MNDKSVGVIPVHIDTDDAKLFCVVQSAAGHWGFPKGHPEGNELEEETARRELEEETGIRDVRLVTNHVFSEVYTFERGGVSHGKRVNYFLGFVQDMSTTTLEAFKSEILAVRWLGYVEARKLITFDESKLLLDEVWIYLQSGI